MFSMTFRNDFLNGSSIGSSISFMDSDGFWGAYIIVKVRVYDYRWKKVTCEEDHLSVSKQSDMRQIVVGLLGDILQQRKCRNKI